MLTKKPKPNFEIAGHALMVSDTRIATKMSSVKIAAPFATAANKMSSIGPERALWVGGGSFGRGGGVGIGTSFGFGRNRPNEVVVTRMAVQIRNRADKAVIWEGRAETEAPARAPAAQPGLAADKLAAALFKDFPGVSGQTVRVP